MTNMIQHILKTSNELGTDRSPVRSILKAQEELGEFSTEVAIKLNHSNKDPSGDGVIGEGCDVIIAVVDTMFLLEPELSMDDIKETILRKLDKWKKFP